MLQNVVMRGHFGINGWIRCGASIKLIFLCVQECRVLLFILYKLSTCANGWVKDCKSPQWIFCTSKVFIFSFVTAIKGQFFCIPQLSRLCLNDVTDFLKSLPKWVLSYEHKSQLCILRKIRHMYIGHAGKKECYLLISMLTGTGKQNLVCLHSVVYRSCMCREFFCDIVAFE